MSAYSDWKVGALPDEEYRSAWRHQRGEDPGEIDIPFCDGCPTEEELERRREKGNYEQYAF